MSSIYPVVIYARGYLTIEGWRVPVVITGERTAYGRLDYRCQQEGDPTSRWVSSERVTVTERGTG